MGREEPDIIESANDFRMHLGRTARLVTGMATPERDPFREAALLRFGCGAEFAVR